MTMCMSPPLPLGLLLQLPTNEGAGLTSVGWQPGTEEKSKVWMVGPLFCPKRLRAAPHLKETLRG